MADAPNKLREVAWAELCPWLMLFRSVRIALMARVLVLGAVGLVVTTLGWRAINFAFGGSEDTVIAAWRTDAHAWIWEGSKAFGIDMSARSVSEVFASARSDVWKAPFDVWLYLTRPFQDLFNAKLTATGFLCLLLCCIWELVVWGVVGGAIARIAALKFTRDEAPSLVVAVRHSSRKLLSYSAAPMIALAGAAVFAVQLFVLGLVMNVSFFAMLAGLLWPFTLLLGLLMAILLIGALVGWPLMWATVAVEGTDAFDALSRSYAYVFQRPWRLLWYAIFAVFLAAVSMFVVKAFAISAIRLGDWSVDWGLGDTTMEQVVSPPAEPSDELAPAPLFQSPVDLTLPPPADPAADPQLPTPGVGDDAAEDNGEPQGMLGVARWGVDFWKSLLLALAAGYQAGFLWVAAVGVYLLLRRDVDGAKVDEVYVEQEEEYGMPPLEEDTSTGVPEVSPGGAAQPGDGGGDQPPAGSS